MVDMMRSADESRDSGSINNTECVVICIKCTKHTHTQRQDDAPLTMTTPDEPDERRRSLAQGYELCHKRTSSCRLPTRLFLGLCQCRISHALACSVCMRIDCTMKKRETKRQAQYDAAQQKISSAMLTLNAIRRPPAGIAFGARAIQNAFFDGLRQRKKSQLNWCHMYSTMDAHELTHMRTSARTPSHILYIASHQLS